MAPAVLRLISSKQPGSLPLTAECLERPPLGAVDLAKSRDRAI